MAKIFKTHLLNFQEIFSGIRNAHLYFIKLESFQQMLILDTYASQNTKVELSQVTDKEQLVLSYFSKSLVKSKRKYYVIRKKFW